MLTWFLSLDYTYQIIFAFGMGIFIDSFFWVLLTYKPLLVSFMRKVLTYSKNKKINAYQRQLEKESISSNESSSRVKVLESKIEVLEKALENALNNK